MGSCFKSYVPDGWFNAKTQPKFMTFQRVSPVRHLLATALLMEKSWLSIVPKGGDYAGPNKAPRANKIKAQRSKIRPRS